MIAFVLPDHTVVANSILFGALGVLVVKKNNSGMELYFAHNTDSFVSYWIPWQYISQCSRDTTGPCLLFQQRSEAKLSDVSRTPGKHRPRRLQNQICQAQQVP